MSALSGASGSPFGGMEPGHDRLEDVAGSRAFLGAGQDRGGCVEADDVLDLPLALLRLRARQVDLVDDRNDIEVVVNGQVGVGERLRLDSLGRIDEQQGAFARRERPRDLVAEIDVAGRVDQVQDVLLTIVGRVVQAYWVRFDGDPAFALEVHGIEHLRLHLARLKRAGELEEAIGQRRLAMVDVRDDRKVPDIALIHRGLEPATGKTLSQRAVWRSNELYLPAVELPNFRHLTSRFATSLILQAPAVRNS